MNQQQMRAQMNVWWILWAAFQVGIFIMYQNLTKGAAQRPQAHAIDSALDSYWLAALAPLAMSIIVRWLILPRVRIAQTALVFFIVGIAFAESVCFLGIFIFPAHKEQLLVCSLAGIFQFIPYYVGRYYPRDDQQMNP
jgi:cytochrome bd-type quinol oxidase subunit 2